MFEKIKFKAQSSKLRNFKIFRPIHWMGTPQSSIFNRHEGFTLLEVMIALSIVAGVIITILASLNYQLGIVNNNRDVVIATILGKKVAGETALLTSMEQKKGNFGSAFPQYSWELNLEDTQFKTLKRMDMKVLWGKGREVSIASYKIKKLTK